MKSIQAQVSRRHLELVQKHDSRRFTIEWTKNGPRKRVFFMPDDFIRIYYRIIKKRYGLRISNCIFKVFTLFCSYANSQAICYPSLDTIMKLTCISNRPQLKRVLKIMEDELLMIACNPGKGRSVNVYAIIHINHWKPVNSIETEIIVANQNMKQFQNTDTRRTVFKDPNYKDEKPEENIEIIE